MFYQYYFTLFPLASAVFPVKPVLLYLILVSVFFLGLVSVFIFIMSLLCYIVSTVLFKLHSALALHVDLILCYALKGKDIEELEYCLNWIHGKSCIGYVNRLRKVYNIEGLAQDLFAHIGHSVSETQVIDLLTAHTWDFEPKTR